MCHSQGNHGSGNGCPLPPARGESLPGEPKGSPWLLWPPDRLEAPAAFLLVVLPVLRLVGRLRLVVAGDFARGPQRGLRLLVTSAWVGLRTAPGSLTTEMDSGKALSATAASSAPCRNQAANVPSRVIGSATLFTAVRRLVTELATVPTTPLASGSFSFSAIASLLKAYGDRDRPACQERQAGTNAALWEEVW